VKKVRCHRFYQKAKQLLISLMNKMLIYAIVWFLSRKISGSIRGRVGNDLLSRRQEKSFACVTLSQHIIHLVKVILVSFWGEEHNAKKLVNQVKSDRCAFKNYD